MHEINIHTQPSDKYENKLGSDNRMKKQFSKGSLDKFISRSYFKRQIRIISKIMYIRPQIMVRKFVAIKSA